MQKKQANKQTKTRHEKVTEHGKSMFQLEIVSVLKFMDVPQNILLYSTWFPCFACFLEAKTLAHGTDKKAQPNPWALKGRPDLKLTLLH